MMNDIQLKILTGLLITGLMVMMVRDFRLGRVPAVHSFLSVSYARRDETPILFWLFTVGRVAVIGFLAWTLLN